MTIDSAYELANPRSRQLFEEQRALIPGGFSHRARVLTPFPLFISRNVGAHKWDVDGHEYIDYWLGHGALLLGHGHPIVAASIREQLAKGLHAGGETELGLEWARLVRELIPSAEAVRFVSSGGEATQMAIRVARAHSGKSTVLTFQGAFHGWHDVATVGQQPPWDVPSSAGVPSAVGATVKALPFLDLEAVERVLRHDHTVAAIMLEPGGTGSDTVPTTREYLAGLRDLATAHGVLLIFDEVVSGFRYAKGGAQQLFGVIPDLVTLGKVLGGGLAAGALAGRAEVMDVLAWKPDPEWQRYEMVPHPGTWNAAPITAAAGVATLRLVRDTDAVAAAIETTRVLIDGLNAAFEAAGIEAFAYGRASWFKTCPGKQPELLHGVVDGRREDEIRQLRVGWGERGPSLRKAMLLEGVDLMRSDGFVSAEHGFGDVRRTAQSLERALTRLKHEGWG